MKFQILLLTLALLVLGVFGKHQSSKNEDDQDHVRARRNHKINHVYPTVAPIAYPEVVPDEEYVVKPPPVEHHVSHLYHGTEVEKPYVSTHGVHHQISDAYTATGTNYPVQTPVVAYPQVQEAQIPYEEEISYEETPAASVVDNQEYYTGSVYEELPSKEITKPNVPLTNYPSYIPSYYPNYYPTYPQFYSPYYQSPSPYVPQVPYYYPQGPIYYPPQGSVYPSAAIQGDNSQYSKFYNIPASTSQYGAYLPNTPYYYNEHQYTRDLPYSIPETTYEGEGEVDTE